MSRAFTKERDDAPEPPLVLRRRRTVVHTEPPADPGAAGIGAHVTVEGAGAQPRAFLIVDPESSDVRAGRIGADAPLAQALLGAHAGDVVVWHRPLGDCELRVISVAYD